MLSPLYTGPPPLRFLPRHYLFSTGFARVVTPDHTLTLVADSFSVLPRRRRARLRVEGSAEALPLLFAGAIHDKGTGAICYRDAEASIPCQVAFETQDTQGDWLLFELPATHLVQAVQVLTVEDFAAFRFLFTLDPDPATGDLCRFRVRKERSLSTTPA